METHGHEDVHEQQQHGSHEGHGHDTHHHGHGHDHGHHHGHHHHHHHHHEVQGNILVAFLVNLGFAVVELVGGILTNSVAILSDSVHDLGDALVIGVSYLLERKSRAGADERHSYGYRRYSTVGALVTTIVLLAGSVGVIIGAVPRLITPVPVDHGGMLLLAVFGIAANGFAAWRTSGGSSLNQRAVSLHMLEDVLGWVAVLVGAVVIRLTGWTVIDPLISIGIASFIAWNAVGNLMGIAPVFLEEVPSGMSVDELAEEVVESVDAVTDVHHVHVWHLDEDTVLATLHVVWDGHVAGLAEAKASVRSVLAEHGISHSTIEMETVGEMCPETCEL